MIFTSAPAKRCRNCECTIARWVNRGEINRAVVQNAVLILHGTSGSGKQFFVDEFAGELFGKGQPLDAERFFIIVPDDLGHGQSSKPSDGLHAKFPRYGYLDMVEAQHRLVADGLKVNHLRLVLGTSMGGMHTWLWGEQYPAFMDALTADGQPACADFRPQPNVAQDCQRGHPHRSPVEQRRIHNPTAPACEPRRGSCF